MSEIVSEIPRFYTGIAEWLSCVLFVFCLPRKYTNGKTLLLLTFSLMVFVFFHQFAGALPVIFWVGTMLFAVLLMFLTLYSLTTLSKKNAGYYTVRAFLIAEFLASLEWQFHSFFGQELSQAFSWFFLIGSYLILFAVFYFFEQFVIQNDGKIMINRYNFLIAVGLCVFTFVISNISYVGVRTPFTMYNLNEIFIMRSSVDFGGIALLYILHIQITDASAKKEVEMMKRILSDQYNQYKLSKRNMEMIQLKYHDIKNQLSVIRTELDPKKQEQYLEELEQSIEKNQFQYETGNRILDIIVTQKSQVCQEKKIEMTCILNGKLIDFISAMDISSIFGNALDNAIEYESKNPDPEKRLIQVSLYEKNHLIFIQVENYSEEELQADKEGNWQTTKRNKSAHGFGLKSIQYSVEKYHGEVTLEKKGNWVQLKILIPHPRT